jgi:hypothetical protein
MRMPRPPPGCGRSRSRISRGGSDGRRAPPVWPWTAEPDAAFTLTEKKHWSFASGLPIDEQRSVEVTFFSLFDSRSPLCRRSLGICGIGCRFFPCCA